MARIPWARGPAWPGAMPGSAPARYCEQIT